MKNKFKIFLTLQVLFIKYILSRISICLKVSYWITKPHTITLVHRQVDKLDEDDALTVLKSVIFGANGPNN